MKHMNYLDIPVIRSAGFQSNWSGMSWFGKDRYGKEWNVDEDLDTGLLVFDQTGVGSKNMTREEFSDLFEVEHA